MTNQEAHAFIADLCARPYQNVTGLKIRELLDLQEHAAECVECQEKMDAVLRAAKKQADFASEN